MISKIEFVDEPLSDNYVFLIASYKHPKHQEIIGAFNRGLTIILEDGTYQKIMEENKLERPKMFQHIPSK